MAWLVHKLFLHLNHIEHVNAWKADLDGLNGDYQWKEVDLNAQTDSNTLKETIRLELLTT
jgi:hypothetical protein